MIVFYQVASSQFTGASWGDEYNPRHAACRSCAHVIAGLDWLIRKGAWRVWNGIHVFPPRTSCDIRPHVDLSRSR